MSKANQIETIQLHITGLIQGVGFRPFIYRLALEHNLTGYVHNQNNGVIINIQGTSEQKNLFINAIERDSPNAAQIDHIKKETLYNIKYKEFNIGESKKIDNTITSVSPDIAVCPECLSDMQNQQRRKNYSFTNCTNCGPRFSIVSNIPYDRKLTSMRDFEMCPECEIEYKNILDRRFHAQPVACNNCGPTYTFYNNNMTKQSGSISQILKEIVKIIESGGTLAIKGLGGYHLVCDAFNKQAIHKLRKIKERDGKPFALMFNTIEEIKKFNHISKEEENLINSWQRPIVLVNSTYNFPEGIADKLDTMGVFLPYLPFHYQMFDAINTPALVMTSGNISHCPIVTDNQNALNEFLPKTDGILIHNREIINRVDDSVVQVINNQAQILRRSRGYAPSPIQLHLNTEGILATGAELANTFCIGKGKQAIMSQHIGDLKNLETSSFFEQSFETYKRLFEFEPKHIVCDLHPDYLSTKFAEGLKLPLIKTQHHHAHIASCMAEYGIDEPVIGVAYDGTGYGIDGKIWGSEIMVASLDSFERKNHFEYIPIPGGDKVAEQPWRSAIAYLFNAFEGNIPGNLSFLNAIPSHELNLINLALEKDINCPESCSAGRLFDAVAALINSCTHSSYHAEAPILLEHAIENDIDDFYVIDANETIYWSNTIKNIVNDLTNNVSPSIISAKFHNTVAQVTFQAIKKIHAETGINKVILSGGTFQNMYLSKKLLDLLSLTGLNAYMSNRVPVNDGGLSLGQLAIAAKKLTLCV